MASRPAFAIAIAIAAAFIFALAGCSAGGSGHAPVPYVAADTVQTVGDAADALAGLHSTGSERAKLAINATNALGSAMRTFAAEIVDEAPFGLSAGSRAPAPQTAIGRCHDGVTFYAPDVRGDPSSTELLVFSDPGCAQVAVDAVRLYTPTGSNGETVTTTTSLYPPHGSAPEAAIAETSQISNASFDRYGFPVVADGFARTTTSSLFVSNAKQLVANSEIVIPPGNGGAFCQDSAGYSLTGIPSLDATFGWQGGALSNGIRTIGGSDFVTWSAKIVGTAFQGSIGSLSIATSHRNAICPIATPAFTLRDDAAVGNFSIPVTVATHHGALWSLAVKHAVLPGGYVLTVTTTRGRRPGDRAHVDGTFAQGNARIASFRIDAFGNGTLTITSTGAQYKITDWIVVNT